jgi:hypothetical protein
MAKIILEIKNITEALTFKDGIESSGLHHGVDYHWKYIPKISSWLGDEVVRPASVEFDFVDDSMATFFRLKWKQ